MGAERYNRQKTILVANAEPNVAGTGFTTDTFDLTSYDGFRVDVEHTRVAATAITFYIEYQLPGGTAWHRLQSVSVAAGTGTLTNYILSKTIAADANYGVRLDAEYGNTRLVFGSTAGGATDLTTVYVTKTNSRK